MKPEAASSYEHDHIHKGLTGAAPTKRQQRHSQGRLLWRLMGRGRPVVVDQPRQGVSEATPSTTWTAP